MRATARLLFIWFGMMLFLMQFDHVPEPTPIYKYSQEATGYDWNKDIPIYKQDSFIAIDKNKVSNEVNLDEDRETEIIDLIESLKD